MRRSSLLMLAAAIVLGLIAVFIARIFLVQTAPTAPQVAVQTVPAVVAAAPIAFGEKLTADKLKVVNWPAGGIPEGSFQRIPDALTDDKVALRAIDANELVTAKALSSKDSRLSTSPLLGETMRAVSLPIGETSGVAGFIAPGDRVDVYVTRAAEEDVQAHTDQLMQGVRVLAVGQDNNVGKNKPEVVRTATIEVTPQQAQKLALAQTVGSLSLSLRNIVDESRVPLQTAQILDLNDGIPTRLVIRRKVADAAPPPPAGPPGGASRPPVPVGPSIDVYRGGKPTNYPVPGL